MTGPTWPSPRGANVPPPGLLSPRISKSEAAKERASASSSSGARGADGVTRLCLWSGPRNVSTAILYSFAQRADTRVVDEPLYAHYLRVSGADHPGRDEVLAAMEQDGAKVVRDVVLGPCDRPVLFQKHMAHHLVELDRGFLAQTTNVLLIRDPAEVVVTLSRQVKEPALRDVGIAAQCELFDQLRALGQEPPVLDAKETTDDPEGVLRELCRRVGLPWDRAMLSWPEGAKPFDGVWARHWYHNVHHSTGFEKRRPSRVPPPDRLKPLIEQCRPYYERLRPFVIAARRRDSSGSSASPEPAK
jgi:hypothetical protein